MKSRHLSLILLTLSLCACELLGIPDPAKEAERKDAEGKAIGSACRHAGRALEDCFSLNTTAQKASVFAGWKEMNDYMAQNKIENVKPELVPGGVQAEKPAHGEAAVPDDAAESAAPEPKTGSKSRNKASTKLEKPEKSDKTATEH
ncbi:MAG: hypothetical protein IPO35_01180 [Uliginosibacterium sp.]|jgi:hypothetical protein|nr:hypothetical protein [Uliginosibacterium sp.]